MPDEVEEPHEEPGVAEWIDLADKAVPIMLAVLHLVGTVSVLTGHEGLNAVVEALAAVGQAVARVFPRRRP